MISFTVSLPPSANNLFRNVPRVGRVKMPEYKAWEKANEWLVTLACNDGRKIDGPFALTVKVGKPDRRRRDLDNILKPTLDLLVRCGGVKDDSDCQRIEASWSDQHEGVFVLVLPTQPVPPIAKRTV